LTTKEKMKSILERVLSKKKNIEQIRTVVIDDWSLDTSLPKSSERFRILPRYTSMLDGGHFNGPKQPLK
jgi:hypothetical protein